jgi:hypothetical protein
MMTPIDPLFVLLPVLAEIRKKVKHLGMIVSAIESDPSTLP